MKCPGCGLMTAVQDGPTHPYVVSSPGCWAIYGEVLAREYQNPEASPLDPIDGAMLAS